MKIAVFFNPAAGASRRQPALEQDIRDVFNRHSLSVELYRLSELEQILQAILPDDPGNPGVLVAAGGDGTISQIAGVCIRERLPLGVLPLGTWNNFARDAGIPLELESAIECIAANNRRRIDVATVNGRVFVNNSSIGAYPEAVHERRELQARLPLHKRPAMALAVLRVFHRRPLLLTKILADGAVIPRRTPFVFVGNNEYSIRFSSPRLRTSLNRGNLCLITARSTGIHGFFRLLWLALSARIDKSDEFEKVLAQQITIDLPVEKLRVSRDGEVDWMDVPLRYGIEKEALELIAP